MILLSCKTQDWLMKTYLLILLLFFSVACNEAENSMSGDVDAEFDEMVYIPPTHQPPPPGEEGEPIKITKKVIKTGGIDFQTEDIEETYKAIGQILPKYGAYIEDENQSKSTHQITYNLTIRVPSTIYDSLFTSLTNIAAQVDRKHSNIEDVTERYYDLKTRIKNKKVLEQRYLELLSKAAEIKDILEIEKNLNEIRVEIEQLGGHFNYLSKQVKFSTIKLMFYEVLPYEYDSSQQEGFGARLLSALDDGWHGFLEFVVGFISLWPFILLIGGLVFVVRRYRGRWWKKK